MVMILNRIYDVTINIVEKGFSSHMLNNMYEVRIYESIE